MLGGVFSHVLSHTFLHFVSLTHSRTFWVTPLNLHVAACVFKMLAERERRAEREGNCLFILCHALTNQMAKNKTQGLHARALRASIAHVWAGIMRLRSAWWLRARPSCHQQWRMSSCTCFGLVPRSPSLRRRGFSQPFKMFPDIARAAALRVLRDDFRGFPPVRSDRHRDMFCDFSWFEHQLHPPDIRVRSPSSSSSSFIIILILIVLIIPLLYHLFCFNIFFFILNIIVLVVIWYWMIMIEK